MSDQSKKNEAFAIVGMGCVFPNAFNVDHYWQTLVKGHVSFMPPPKELWDSDQFYSSDRRQPDKYYDEIVSYPNGFQFPKDQFKCPPDQVANLGRREQYLYAALNECHSNIKNFSKRTKVFLGHTSLADFMNPDLLIHELKADLGFQKLTPTEQERLIQDLREVVDSRSHGETLDQQMTHQQVARAIKAVMGDSYPMSLVDAACASSLYTLDLGIFELLKGEIDLAICGGMSFSDPLGKVLFCRLGGSSRQGVFPFQSRADGTVFGEGAGFVGVKLLSKALKDGDVIYSVIRGLGTSSDGKGKSIYAPNSGGQVLAVEKAYTAMQIDPKTIQYVEAHGTGTPAGDSVEFKSLQTYFERLQLPRESVGLGSVKGLFGHLGWAAGVASVIKLALCLRNKTLVGQHHFETLNPAIDIEKSPFIINRQNIVWPENKTQPRRACINGFGFGGTNAHLVIEEFTGSETATGVFSAPQASKDPIVVVGVGCVLPKAASWAELCTAWDAGQKMENRFPNGYKPNNIKFRIIDRSASVIDPTQFMLLEAAGQVVTQLGNKIGELRKEVGVFVAQTGCLAKQLPHMKRVYSEAVRNRIVADPSLSSNSELTAKAESLVQSYRNDFPVPNEDSNPGIMPNVMAGRICNYFDFNGPNLSINSGFGTFAETIWTAVSNLQYGRCVVAMVATANAATSSAFEELWTEWSGKKPGDLAEGSVAIGLMKKSDAQKHGLEILATLKLDKSPATQAPPANFMQQMEESKFGYLFSAPEAHLFLDGIYQARKKQAKNFAFTDDNRTAWKFQVGTDTQKMEVPSNHGFLIDQVVSSRPDGFVCHRKMTVATDPYLDQHTVRGKPTLPGTFMIEMTAQAFRAALPNMKIVELTDMQFLRFIRPPLDIRVEAKLVRKTATGAQYALTLFSDKYGPKNFLLQKDIKHFSCQVHVVEGAQVPVAPPCPQFEEVGSLIHDPYHEEGSDVYLSGVFKTISQMKGNSTYKWGNFDLSGQAFPAQLENGAFAPLLLDGALRLGALDNDPNQEPIFPVSIQSLKIYSQVNDQQLHKSGRARAIFERKSSRILLVDGHQIVYEMQGFHGQTNEGKSLASEAVPVAKKTAPRPVLGLFPNQNMDRYVPTFKAKPLIHAVRAAASKPYLIVTKSAMTRAEVLASDLGKLNHKQMDYQQALLLKANDLNEFEEIIFLVNLPEVNQISELDKREAVLSDLQFCHQLCQQLADTSDVRLMMCIGFSWRNGEAHPLVGILRGFLRSFYQELSGERVRMLLSDKACGEMTKEIWSESQAFIDHEVIYLNHERYVTQLQQRTSPPMETPFALKDDGVVLFSGGGRGIGGYLSAKWAELYPNNRLAILGRSSRGQVLQIQKDVISQFGNWSIETFIKYSMKKAPAPVPKVVAEFNRLCGELELEQCLQSIEKQGAQVEYYVCDVTNAKQVKETIQKVYARFQRIDVVIHSAGSDSSKKIQAKTWAEVEHNFRVKVDGFFNLFNYVKISEVQQWVNFGSIVYFYGNSGQTDYGAANDLLNTVGQFVNNRLPNCRVTTMNWGSWDEVGMAARTKALKDLIHIKGWVMLQPSEAAICFFRELNYGEKGDSQIIVYNDQDQYTVKPKSQRSGGKVG